jgi:hypothetical protein
MDDLSGKLRLIKQANSGPFAIVLPPDCVYPLLPKKRRHEAKSSLFFAYEKNRKTSLNVTRRRV